MNERLFLSPPHMGGEEINYINAAFQANWISPAGPNLDEFENVLAQYNGMPYCAAVSSGTAAIHLALIILGVQPGDEVICSSFTFSGSCNPIAYQKAIPVFVDSERETWNIDPELLRTCIEDRIKKGNKPKAIIAVHLYGMPAQIDKIMAIAKEFEIPVIEDAAEGLGSTYKGKKLGTFGDFGIFSFNGNKIITTSGGGAIVAQNKEWIQKAKFLSTQARDAAPHYQHSHIGYNYRLSNICAGIGIGQMKVLDQRVTQRRKIFDYYQNRLSKSVGFVFQPEVNGSFSNRWLSCALLSHHKFSPEELRLRLEKQNIESRPLWKPMHLQPVFRDCPAYKNGVSENLFNTGICLPSGSAMTEAQLDTVCSTIEKI